MDVLTSSQATEKDLDEYSTVYVQYVHGDISVATQELLNAEFDLVADNKSVRVETYVQKSN